MKVYLDNGATTKVDERVIETMLPFFKEKYGNASSLHSFGIDAYNSLNESRTIIASKLNAKPEEIIFTSGGTESNNTVIFSIERLVESKKLNKICPKCRKELTIGVEYRVEELADREKPINVPEFKTLIPLTELISSIYGIKQLQSKKILEIYNKLISNFKNEYNILIKTKEDDLRKIVHEKLSNLIIKNREGKLNITPGYDGIYGKIILEEKDRIKEQKTLTNY